MMNLIGTILVYLGLLTFLVGGMSILRPLTFLGIWSRFQGVMLLVVGVLLFLIGVKLPAREGRVETPTTHLDEFVPAYEFGEFHSIRIEAPRERVYAAIREVTADEITLFRTLTWIRRFGRPGPESILNAPPNEPILAVATRTSFMKLAEEPGREIVLGTLAAASRGTPLKKDPTPEDFKALQAPGFALAAINFRLEDALNGETILTTETRVYATDASVRKKFAAYWRIIYPGSALIRVMWLRAIRNRAEQRYVEEDAMIRERALKVVLVLVGLLFTAGIYPVTMDLWHADPSDTGDTMMMSLYFTLGVFLLMAARKPSAHRSVIAFAAWSSFAHAVVMSALALQPKQASERAGFLGGSAVLVVIGVALIALAPAKPSGELASAAGA